MEHEHPIRKERKNVSSEMRISHLRETVPHGDLLFHMRVHDETITAGEEVALYPHWHDELELLYLEKGSAEFTAGGESFFLSPGQVVVIQPNVLHSAGNPLKEEIAFTAVLVHSDFLSSLLQDDVQRKYVEPLFEKTWLLPCCRQDSRREGKLLDLLREIAGLYREKPDGFELLIKAYLFQVLFLLWKEMPEKEPEDAVGMQRAEQMKKAIQFMQKAYDGKVTVKDVAEYLHMSEGHFSRVFRENCRIPPMEYLISCRISQAARLLRETDKKMTEIAMSTGFNSVNYFTGAFHKRMGCSPREYRNALQKGRISE